MINFPKSWLRFVLPSLPVTHRHSWSRLAALSHDYHASTSFLAHANSSSPLVELITLWLPFAVFFSTATLAQVS
jgi:hypothetical protein